MVDNYCTVKEISEKWDIGVRTVQTMCVEGRIVGAVKFGREWAIPHDAEKPKDGIIVTGRYRKISEKNK